MTKAQPIRSAPSPRTFCSFAWDFVCVSLRSATTQVCCKTPIHNVTASEIDQFGFDVIDNTNEYRQRRSALLAGVEHSDCAVCWNLERVGGMSFRKKAATWELPKYLESINAKGGQDADRDNQSLLAALPSRSSPKFVQIKLGNPCDLKCIYCCSYFSSSWEAEEENAGIQVMREPVASPELQEQFSDAFWSWFGKLEGEVREVEFMGGEPTFNASLYEALDKMKAVCSGWDASAMPLVSLITNLNTPPIHWKRLRRFVEESDLRFRFTISNEAWGERAEYIRFGLQWPRFQANFAELVEMASRNDRIDLLTLPSLTALCISSLSQYLEWVRDLSEGLHGRTGRHIGVFVNEVVDPLCLSIGVLPARYADYLDPAVECMRRWDPPEVRVGEVHPPVFQVLEEAQRRIRSQHVDPELSAQFNARIQTNDQRRSLDCRSVFPEYGDVLTGEGDSGENHEQRQS